MTQPVHLPREYAIGKAAPPAFVPRPRVLRFSVNNSGIAKAKFGPVPGDERWWIEYLTTAADGGTPSLNVFVDDETQPSNLFDLTDDGVGAVAFYSPARQLAPDSTLVFVWSGGVPKSVCSARVEYRVEKL